MRILFFFFGYLSFGNGAVDKTEEMQLFDDLFINNVGYSPHARPVLNKNQTVLVKMNIALAQVVELNDRDQSLSTSIWIRQFWKNELVTWNPNDYGNITELTIGKKWIWTPDLVLYNSVELNLNGQLDQYKTRIIIRYDGQHTWYIPAIITAGCSIDILYFPFDYQKCPMQFGSWSYSSPELDLEVTRSDVDISFYQESSHFWLIKTAAVRNSIKYSCCPDPLTDITFTIVLQRKASFHMFNVIMPTLVLTFYSLFTFAFPEETGERNGLAMDCFLTISILMMMVSDMMPIDSNVTPLLGVFMLTSLVSITFSIFMNAVCFNMHRTISMPVWLHDLIFKRILPLTMFKSCVASLRKSGTCNKYAFCEGFFAASMRRKQSETARHFEEMERLRELKNYANQFSPMHAYEVTNTILDTHGLDEAFTASYDFIQQKKKKFDSNSSSFKYQPYCNNNEVGDEEDEEIKKSPSLSDGVPKKKNQNQRDIAHIQHLVEKVYEDMEADVCTDFWRCVAQTSERLLLICVSLLYGAITVSLIYRIPKDSIKLNF